MPSNVHDYFCSSTESYGYKVLLHSPNDVPKVADYGFALPTGFESRIAITPTLDETTDAVRRIPKHIRQCVFENENFLSFFRYIFPSTFFLKFQSFSPFFKSLN